MDIQGLSPLQQEIAKKLWACDTVEQRDQAIQMMPKNAQKNANLVVQLMLITVIDQHLDKWSEFPEIKEFLNNL
jgi:hypothetical protein